MISRQIAVLYFVTLSLCIDYCYSDGITKKVKKTRLGQPVTNNSKFQHQDRKSFNIPGVNKDVNVCATDSMCEEGEKCRNMQCVGGNVSVKMVDYFEHQISELRFLYDLHRIPMPAI